MVIVNRFNQSRFVWKKITELKPGQYQPRHVFSHEQLQSLASSIAAHGVLQPLLIDENDFIIAGERRFRAAKYIGLEELPCIQVEALETQKALIAILENIQREQIEPLEEGLAYQRLQQEYQWTHDHIAKLLGKSRAHISNMLRLLKGSDAILKALKDKKISYGHMRALLALSPITQEKLLAWTIEQQASVRALEQKIKHEKVKVAQVSKHEHFLQTLAHQVGAPVELEEYHSGEGFLKFKYFDQETLAGLLQKLGLSYD